MTETETNNLWYQADLDVFLNRWFSNYTDARQSLDSDGGFLLPYKQHFFVCEADAIRALGLEPDDPDWERIGRDCAKPSDEEAYQRLSDKREKIVGENS